MSNPIAKFSRAVGLVFLGLAFQLCALTVASNSLFSGRASSPWTDQVALATEERVAEQDVADIVDDDLLAALADSHSSHPGHSGFKGIAQSNYLPENPGHSLRDRAPPVSRI